MGINKHWVIYISNVANKQMQLTLKSMLTYQNSMRLFFCGCALFAVTVLCTGFSFYLQWQWAAWLGTITLSFALPCAALGYLGILLFRLKNFFNQ